MADGGSSRCSCGNQVTIAYTLKNSLSLKKVSVLLHATIGVAQWKESLSRYTFVNGVFNSLGEPPNYRKNMAEGRCMHIRPYFLCNYWRRAMEIQPIPIYTYGLAHGEPPKYKKNCAEERFMHIRPYLFSPFTY